MSHFNDSMETLERTRSPGHCFTDIGTGCYFQLESITEEAVTIRELGGRTSVKGNAERIVAHLQRVKLLTPGRRLFCFDSMGELHEIAR